MLPVVGDGGDSGRRQHPTVLWQEAQMPVATSMPNGRGAGWAPGRTLCREMWGCTGCERGTEEDWRGLKL
jgi:hypothetical protein